MARLVLVCLLTALATLPLAAQQAAIRAKGIIESTETGFRFPDGTVQATAATVTGGVPSVNGIPGAVTIAANGGNSVTTASGTITIAGPWKRTVIVSPVPGNPIDSGLALVTALDEIVGNSATNPWLLRIEPGIYDLGEKQLAMKSFVDLEGSGENTTIIRGHRSGLTPVAASAAVVGASNSQLRQLTIENVALVDGYSIAVFGSGLTNFTLRDVTVMAQGSLSVGMRLESCDTDANRVRVESRCNNNGSATGLATDGTSNTIFIGEVLADATAGCSVATGVSVDGTSNTLLLSESEVRTTGATNASFGVRVIDGNGRVTNSTIAVESSTERYGVQTGAPSTANLAVYDSRVLVGDVWNDPNIVALYEGVSSTLRVYTSLIDGPRGGTPLCVYTFTSAGASTCPAPTP